MRRGPAIVAALLVAGALAVTTGAGPALYEQVRVRLAIRALRDAPGGEGRAEALGWLCGRDGAALRFQLPALLDALDSLLAPPDALDRLFAQPLVDWSEHREGLCGLMARIARWDCARLVALRPPERNPFVHRALLAIGRADLACAAPRFTELAPSGAADRFLSVEWGATRGSLWMPADGQEGMVAPDPELSGVYVLAAAAGRTEIALVATDAEPALDPASYPGPADPRWRPARERGLLDVEEGETYALHISDGRTDLGALLHVAVLIPGHRLRLAWRVVEARRIGGAAVPVPEGWGRAP